MDDIFEYMYGTYINGNPSQLKALYKELCREARKVFIAFCFEMVSPQHRMREKWFLLVVHKALFGDGRA